MSKTKVLSETLKERISDLCEEQELNEKSFQKDILYLMENGYDFLDFLGKGRFGVVIKSKSISYGEVAVKLMSKKKTKSEDFDKEIDSLESFKQAKHLIQYYTKLESDVSYIIVSELCDCTLTQIIKNNNLTMSQLYALTKQLLLGICEMKRFGVAHCDIKPDNILYSSKKNSFLYGDFGISKNLLNSLLNYNTEVGGTYQYIAPEIYEFEKQLTYKVDIYSLGVVITEIIAKRLFTASSGEVILLRNDELLKVIEITNENKDFCYTILINMVRKDFNQRLEPNILIMILENKFKFDENELNSLVKWKQELNHELIVLSTIQNLEKYQDRTNIEFFLNQFSIIGTPTFGKSEVIKLSAALKQMTSLTKLSINISGQKIGDEGIKLICESLKSLKYLTSLSLELYQNEINENGFESISSVLRQLINITSLSINLKDNQFNKIKAQTLSDALLCLKSIANLSLDFSEIQKDLKDINQKEVQIICRALKQLSSLKQLSLNFNYNYNEQGAEFISDALKSLTSITDLSLNLENSEILGVSASNLFNQIEKLTSITKLQLNIKYNQATEKGDNSLSDALRQLKSITHLSLNLNQNWIRLNFAKNLSDSIKSLTNITQLSLNLHLIKILDIGAQIIFNALNTLTSLTELGLELGRTEINDNSIQNIPNALKSIRLTKFSLGIDLRNIKEKGILSICQALSQQTSITILAIYFSGSGMGDFASQQLSEALQSLSSLTSLSLSLFCCDVSEVGVYFISKALKSMNHLDRLYINMGNNNICDCGALLLFNGIKQLVQNTSLSLHLKINNNNISDQTGQDIQNQLNSLKSVTVNFFRYDNWGQSNSVLSKKGFK